MHKIFLLITLLMLLNACVPSTISGLNSGKGSLSKTSGSPSSGKGSISGTANPSIVTTLLQNGAPSIQQIIDPYDGTFKNKVTIPKNFAGTLYITGLNIMSLRSNIFKVRFSFGRTLEPIEIPATIGVAPGGGLIPGVDIQAIAINMANQPFKQMRLLYDLFDYSTASQTLPSTAAIPASNPKDIGLYCRGLNLQDDPTFSGAGNNTACDASGEICKYAYAKILDNGLTDTSNIIHFPSMAQIDYLKVGLNTDTANFLKRCLPETSLNATSFTDLFSTSFVSPTLTLAGPPSSTYTFSSPYFETDTANWQISSAALYGVTGIYSSSSPTKFSSLMFPRAGKIDLQAGVNYLGNTTNPYGVKTLQTTSVSGTTAAWLSGCSIRQINYNASTNQGINSCNVTAKIEVISTDTVTGATTVLDSSKTLKLQLVRDSMTDYLGNEVLYTALKTCNQSTGVGCGSAECCFNNRCWSQDVVSSCPTNSTSVGNLGVGATCNSDFQCSSLCCNASTSKCGVHETVGANPQSCNKSPGQTCVATGWCAKQAVSTCIIVKTGINANGSQTCALRCYQIPTFGQCVNGTCQAPVTPTPEVFDPANPNCTNAKDPPIIP